MKNHQYLCKKEENILFSFQIIVIIDIISKGSGGHRLLRLLILRHRHHLEGDGSNELDMRHAICVGAYYVSSVVNRSTLFNTPKHKRGSLMT